MTLIEIFLDSSSRHLPFTLCITIFESQQLNIISSANSRSRERLMQRGPVSGCRLAALHCTSCHVRAACRCKGAAKCMFEGAFLFVSWDIQQVSISVRSLLSDSFPPHSFTTFSSASAGCLPQSPYDFIISRGGMRELSAALDFTSCSAPEHQSPSPLPSALKNIGIFEHVPVPWVSVANLVRFVFG